MSLSTLDLRLSKTRLTYFDGYFSLTEEYTVMVLPLSNLGNVHYYIFFHCKIILEYKLFQKNKQII